MRSEMKHDFACHLFVGSEGPAARFNISEKGLRKVTSALWGTLDEFIVTGHDNGQLVQWDIKVMMIQ